MRDCPLCQPPKDTVLWQDAFARVVLLDDPDYPAYCRVELIEHIKEMTDLAPQDRAKVMKIVFAVETALRETLDPDKINLASLGNMTPHVHWHVIPRYQDDKHFPNSHWGEATQTGNPKVLPSTTKENLQNRMRQLIDCALRAA